MAFDEDTALSPAGDGVWEGEVVDGWNTPRGPLGGYVMAIVLRGLELAVADPERQARSVTMHFLRPPQPGPVTVTADGGACRPLAQERQRAARAGRQALRSRAGRVLEALAGTAAGRVADARGGAGRPGGRTGRRLRDATPPPFTERMVMQRRFGEPPFSGAARSETGGWLGIREERPVDSLAVAVLADAWYPAPWPRLSELAPAPTIDLTVHFRSPLPAPGPLLLGRFRSRYVRDGFFEEDGELWSADGTLVAQSRQLGLLIGAKT